MDNIHTKNLWRIVVILIAIRRVEDWFTSPPSSNRTGGFPAYGFPTFLTLYIMAAIRLTSRYMLSSQGKGFLFFGLLELFNVVSRVSPDIHSLLCPLIPVNEVRVLSSARFCCPRITGTMTPSNSLLAACHFTLRVYRFALYGIAVRGRVSPVTDTTVTTC
jgi:hypothetical protein